MTPTQIHKNSEKALKPTVESKPRSQTITAEMSGLDVQLAMQYPQVTSANTILRLQRLVGNRAVQRLVQRKLVVGAAHDSYEREADQVAHRVMSTPAKPVQRVEDEEEEPLQAKPLASSVSPVMQRQAAHELTHTLQQTGGAARRIQRLMGRQELLYRAGAPKKSFFMSGTYKAILKDLEKYEAFLQPVLSNAGAFFSTGNKFLDTIETHTDKYLGNHPTGPRTLAIQDLASGIGPERDAYELIRNQFASYKVFPGYMAVNAALAEVSTPPPTKTSSSGGLTSPSTLPTLTPPPPLTLPSGAPNKPLPPTPTGGGTGPTGPGVSSSPPNKPLPPTPTGGGTGPTGPGVSSSPPNKPLPPTPTSSGGTAPTGPMAGPTQKVTPEEMKQYIRVYAELAA